MSPVTNHESFSVDVVAFVVDKMQNAACSREQIEAILGELDSGFLTDVDDSASTKTCHICSRALSVESGWREQHYANRSPGVVVRCRSCADCFADKRALSAHARAQHGNATVKRRFFKKQLVGCEVCGKVLATRSNLQRHRELSHETGENENILCEHCGKLFGSTNKFVVHRNDVHGRGSSFECAVCNKRFTSKSVRNRHVRTFHGDESAARFECQRCGKVLGSGFELKRHHSRAHAKLEHLCHKCGKVFFARDDLSAHLKRHTRVKSSKLHQRKERRNDAMCKICEICGKGFSSGNVLNRHLKHVHNKSHNGFQCVRCNKFFSVLGEITMHFKRVHLKEKNSECLICYKKFFDDRALLAHLRNHLDYRPYQCDVCGKSFKNDHDAKVHRGVHEDRNLPCGKCGRVFRSQRLLDAHGRWHSGRCRYECGDCGATFVRKASLRDHAATHVASRDFPCDLCCRAYWSPAHLSRHRRTHSEEYRCEMCGKVVRALPAFQKHVLTHLDEYRCRDCGAGFTAASRLQAHYKGCSARQIAEANPQFLIE